MRDVTAAIMARNGKIFIARRGAGDPLAFKWEFPGGKVEANETPEACLRREMREEFGLDVTVGDFFAESVYRYRHAAIRLLAYHTFWEGGEITLNAHDAFAWVAPEHLATYDFAPADLPIAAKIRNNPG